MTDREPLLGELRPVAFAIAYRMLGSVRPIGVWSLDFAGDQVTGIRSIVNPDKLAHLGPVGDFTALLTSAT